MDNNSTHTDLLFEDRAVAFIDVLGFKQLVCRACEGNQQALTNLEQLVNLLQNAPTKLANQVDQEFRHLNPIHTSISDSIILSTPLSAQDAEHYDGLLTVIMRCIQLTHIFLENGHLVRGGIEIGKVWHSESNIIGTAFQEAYALESYKASVPRILLGRKAQKYFEELQGHDKESMCSRHDCKDDELMVKSLHSSYIKEAHNHNHNIHDTYARYANVISRTLNPTDPEDQLGAPEKAKWLWFQSYLNHYISSI